jgi:N-acetylmuramoyl-L-alanine amidase
VVAGLALGAAVTVLPGLALDSVGHRRLAASARVEKRASGSGSSWLVGRGGPVVFRSGACVAFPPVGRWNGRTVFVDPGHGGLDPGALLTLSQGSVAEKQVALAVGLRALALIRHAGFRVVLSRVGDSTVARLGAGDLDGRLLTAEGVRHDISARTVCANAAHASVLLGIHLDAYQDPSVAGAETLYCGARRFGSDSARLATLIQRAIVTSLHKAGWRVRNRGVKDDRQAGGPALTAHGDAYGHLLELGPADAPWFRYPSLMPGVVVEPLFLTNAQDARIALSTRGQQALARGLATGVRAYFDLHTSG